MNASVKDPFALRPAVNEEAFSIDPTEGFSFVSHAAGAAAALAGLVVLLLKSESPH